MVNTYVNGYTYTLEVRRYVWNIDGIENRRMWAGVDIIDAVWSEEKDSFDPYVNLDDIVRSSFSIAANNQE
jgi:hypothetical protein